jgi:hypothetical protein
MKWHVSYCRSNLGVEVTLWSVALQSFFRRSNIIPKFRSEVLRKVAVDIIVFRDVTPCRPVDKSRRFSKSCCLFIQIRWIGRTGQCSLLLLQSALQTLVGFGLLYDFVSQSSIFALLSPVSHFHLLRSSSTWSIHLSLGLPTGLDERGSHSVTFLTIFVASILMTWAAHSNLCDFINLTIFFFLIIFSSSLFVLIHHGAVQSGVKC